MSESSSTLSMTIGGQSAATEATFGGTNPATGEVFAQAPQCTRQQLDAAMESAAKAYGDWKTDEGVRRDALRAVAGVLMANLAELAPLLTAEQGKPLNDANLEV